MREETCGLKVSRGQDKTLIEVKLSSNSQYLHGYEVQVEEYGKAENTDKLFMFWQMQETR